MHASTKNTENNQNAVPGQAEALSKAMLLLVNAIGDPDVVNRCPTESLRLELSCHLVETFVQLLKGMFPPTPASVVRKF